MKKEKRILPAINIYYRAYFSTNLWVQSRGNIICILFNDMAFGDPDLFGESEMLQLYSFEGMIEEIIPSEKDWSDFLQILKITDIWKKEYLEHICDGTQWSLDVYFKLPEGKLKLKRVYGSNEYPEGFELFGKALAKLIHYIELKNKEKFEFWQLEID